MVHRRLRVAGEYARTIARGVLPDADKVKAIISRGGVTVAAVYAERMFMEAGFMAELFELLGRHGVVVDMISTSEVTVSFTVDDARELPAAVDEMREAGMSVEVRPGRTVVCVVGARMRQVVGLAARACGAISGAGVNIEMISQGASEINITFLVAEDDATAAVRALHEEFIEKKEQG